MTIKKLQSTFFDKLGSLYPKEEVNSFFHLLIEHRMGLSRSDIIVNPALEIAKNDLDFFLNACLQLQQEKPIQYIIGTTEFYGLTFNVTKDVLIPRPETEELVDWIVTTCKNKKQEATILDIGTGSGCIAVSLAKHLPNSTVYALDVSAASLAIAQQNAQINKATVNFIKQDILNTNSITKTNGQPLFFDIIVSNPPYVRELEKNEIKKNVLAHEPHLALFVKDENPLLFYDKIADISKQQLLKNGLLFFEINQYLASETQDLLQQKKFTDIVLRTDLFGNSRMIKASHY